MTHWTRRTVGGIEAYIASVAAALHNAGHAICLFCEQDAPATRDRYRLPAEVPVWSVEELGADHAIQELRAWAPDIIFAHGLLDPQLEAATLDVAPGIFFAHSYYGTCISGGKTFKKPVTVPCGRKFGCSCLFQYYPHRCGGLSPLTMVHLYRQQQARLRLLHKYRALLTLSAHMRAEYINHGFDAGSVHVVPYNSRLSCDYQVDQHSSDTGDDRVAWPASRLLFAGRMEYLKGASVLLDALPLAAGLLKRHLDLTLAGDGPEMRKLISAADRLRRDGMVDTRFVGWLDAQHLAQLFRTSDVLVVPSLWPEPFGSVGVEAATYGVPAIAFPVGGIREWLIDGVNGCLASAGSPTADKLATAIGRCLEDRTTYVALRRGAASAARARNTVQHVAVLERVFRAVSVRTSLSKIDVPVSGTIAG